jgi:copper(I)-binding protein
MLKSLIYTSFLSLGLVACQPANTAPGISVENGYVRAPLPGQSTAVAYFDIINQGGADVLLAASSDVSARVELHNHIHEGGLMKMRQVEQIDVPRKGKVSFKSGGLHVMMFNADIDEPVTLTLDFKTHKDITVQLGNLSN